MDPKTVFMIVIVLSAIGNFVDNFLTIAGLTKNIVVEGGKVTKTIAIFGNAFAAIGALLALYLLMFHSDYLIKIVSIIF